MIKKVYRGWISPTDLDICPVNCAGTTWENVGFSLFKTKNDLLKMFCEDEPVKVKITVEILK